MSIVRYPGFNVHGFQRDLQREMNRLFDGFFPTSRKNNDDGFESAVWRPVVDVHEDDHAYLLDVELPGLSRDDIKINFQEGTLSIAGERSYEYEKKENGENGAVQGNQKNAHRVERFYGKFHRSFSFPASVNAEGIKASFENGVLRITVPKAETVKPRQISIV
ncbi:MAG: Hsp20/alpha crystallin family protein [Bacteroidetes bacterium]|nr:Hsp20/alpha crystallin family protein [Bacteroidota bacterium]